MKKLYLIILMLSAVLVSSAQPILVGHRGSGYGLESSEEAFRNAKDLGYEYVESDIKVTRDTRFVLSHDDDTKRLGGNLTIAKSSLEELQSETLTQTRSGVTYTGKILSLENWLDLCDELGLKPLIELKWATGVNSNDCSNIPALIKVIEDYGYRDKCIILTSMKPCLEYIRKNYPDIKLQFLTGQYWANHFDWCVEHGIDVDIQAGYFDQSTVRKFHAAGLKVNMWTTNDEAGYRKYAGWGCDFITTDRLRASELPEIIPPEDLPDPGQVNLVFERLWINSNLEGTKPEHIDGTNAQQGTAVKGLFYVNDCSDKLLYVFKEGVCIGSLPGGSGWGCCRDFAGNIILRDDKLTGTTHKFLIYEAGPTPEEPTYCKPVEVEVPLAGQTNFISASGDVLGDGGYIYLYPKNQKGVNIIEMANGVVVSVTQSKELMIEGSAAGYVIPVENSADVWYYQVRNKGIYKYRKGISDDISTGGASVQAPARNSTGGGAFVNINNNLIFIHNSGANYKGGFTVRNYSTGEVLTSVEPIGKLGYEEGGNYSTFNWLIVEEQAPQDYIIYQYSPANGMAAYRLYNDLNGVGNVTVDAKTSVRLENGNITVTGAPAGTDVCVYTLSGALVASGTDTADVSALAAGIYIVRAGDSAIKIRI